MQGGFGSSRSWVDGPNRHAGACYGEQLDIIDRSAHIASRRVPEMGNTRLRIWGAVAGRLSPRRLHYDHAVAVLYTLVPRVETSLDHLPLLSSEQLKQLCAEVAKAQMTDSRFRAQVRAVTSLLRSGERLYWGFATAWDALTCVRYNADPRCLLEVGAPVDVVCLDADPLLTDRRFASPGAGSLISEVPRLAPVQQRRWLEHAVYHYPQEIFRLEAMPESSATVRMPPDLFLHRVLREAMKRVKTPAERRQLRMLPREFTSWSPWDLANWADSHELFRAGHDLFTPTPNRKRSS